MLLKINLNNLGTLFQPQFIHDELPNQTDPKTTENFQIGSYRNKNPIYSRKLFAACIIIIHASKFNA